MKIKAFILVSIFVSIACGVMGQQELKGRLSDSKTGKPVVDAIITPQGMNYRTYSNMEGRFLLIVPDTSVVVDIYAPEYEQVTVNIDTLKNIELAIEPLPLKRLYVGAGMGSNNLCGYIGVRAEIVIFKGLALTLGAGPSSWVYRGGARANYYLANVPLKNYFYGGASYSTGTMGKESNTLIGVSRTETFTDKDGNQRDITSVNNEEVMLKLNPVYTIDVGYGYAARVSRSAKVFIEIGYSFPMSMDIYSEKIEPKPHSSAELSQNSKSAITFSSPGGFSLGIGMSFGI